MSQPAKATHPNHDAIHSTSRHLSTADVAKILKGVAMADWLPSIVAWQGRTIPLTPILWVTSIAAVIVVLQKNDVSEGSAVYLAFGSILQCGAAGLGEI